jgi:hypothetical protein
MSEINNRNSKIDWPVNGTHERQHHDQVVFENVADQYVKGEDVTAHFIILNGIQININEDQIGLLRVCPFCFDYNQIIYLFSI